MNGDLMYGLGHSERLAMHLSPFRELALDFGRVQVHGGVAVVADQDERKHGTLATVSRSACAVAPPGKWIIS